VLLNELRILHATSLLHSTDETVGTIAQRRCDSARAPS
jgi:AraC-like DNA-binding protein